MSTEPTSMPIVSAVRCHTRALKNARFLQETAPEHFTKDPEAVGFGTGVPIEILRGLHRLQHDSPALTRHKEVAEFLRKHRPPGPGRSARDALFHGTIHFAQLTFQTKSGSHVVATADMHEIIAYTKHALVPISEYAAQYGPNSVQVAPALLTKTVALPTAKFTDTQLHSWVNALAADHHLPGNSCVFVVVPKGIHAPEVDANAGYHSKASIPYIVAGVWASGLTLADPQDVYAMVVSHEIAEMVVDPAVGGGDPEVCDPCDLNCGNLTRCYFNASGKYLGSNQLATPGGFPFTFYTCAVVKPAGSSDCPAASANCAYGPAAHS